MERTRNTGGENDHIVVVPGAATTLGRVAQRERQPSPSVDSFELALLEKSKEAAVRRPEGKAGALGASECLRRERIEGTNPEKISAFGSRCDESQATTIGRDDEGSSASAAQIEARLLRREDERTDGAYLNWSAAKVKN